MEWLFALVLFPTTFYFAKKYTCRDFLQVMRNILWGDANSATVNLHEICSIFFFHEYRTTNLIYNLWKTWENLRLRFHKIDIKCKFVLKTKGFLKDVKEKFLAKFVFLEKRLWIFPWFDKWFFSRKTNFAKNFSLTSKILLSSKQIYILYQFCEKVVVNFPMFFTS